MADTTPTPTPPSSNTTNAVSAASSCFQRTLTLYDWWLIKAENDFQGKRLAVAGIPSKITDSSSKKGATRVFVSAPVIKRYDVFSLETADGIYLIIKGFLNEQRTLENGFPPEVFNCFLFGFPPNWEKYAVHCFREESVTGNDSSCAVPDNVPATDLEILFHGLEKTPPITSLVSPEDASGDHEKPFYEDELNASKEISGDNVVFGSSGPFPEDECNASKKMGGVNVVNRRITRSLSIKVCKQKNKPASGFPAKHTDREQISTSVAMDLENPDGEGLKSPEIPVQSQSLGQVNASSEQLVKESATRISRALSTNTKGSHKKKRVIDKTKATSTKRKMTKSASAVTYPQERDGSPLVKVATEKFSSVCRKALSFGTPDGEGMKSPVTPAQSQALGKVNISSEQRVKNSASRISRNLSSKTEGSYNKTTVRDKTKATTPKIKMTNSASDVKYPRKRDGSPLIKGITEKNSLVSPTSSSLRKSRSGRLLLPPLEFWRNQIPVYNVNREVTDIQDGASLVSPFKDPSPSVNCKSKNQKPAA